ncbi:MAG: hypothetical protein IT290_00880 [Deltaproteobacteria bacterium]|nr:hypothetical protein [Deltaproteobacteria bacterium]
MTRYYVPFTHNSPSAVDIKGHRLVILASDPKELADNSNVFGNDEIREFVFEKNEEPAVLADIATQAKGGVVVAPPGISVSFMLSSLQRDLPWVH